MNTTPAKNSTARAAAFPKKAWRKVSLSAADTLALYGKHNRGHLEVQLENNSAATLDPASGEQIAFSYRLLDSNGAVISSEGVRTPLTAAVPAGAEHSQKVAVIIPEASLAAGAQIQVGLLIEGQYWVDSLYPSHPITVRIHKPEGLSAAESRLEAASQIWPQRRGNGMRWPYGAMMVSEADKLMYIPVAKCACTSLKSMMIRLAGVDRADIAVQLGVHLVTDRFNTGVQLKDKPIQLAREILASDQYFKFSVIRDPFERLVSAYLEKFVYKRHSQRNLLHTRQVISEVQGTADINLQLGISFDQFAEYILAQDAYDLDAHWRPQHLYFRGVPHISRIFRLENIGELERYLLEQLGVEVKLGHDNRTSKSDIHLPQAATLNAHELDEQDAISPGSFAATRHLDALRDYYREDFEFYSTAS